MLSEMTAQIGTNYIFMLREGNFKAKKSYLCLRGFNYQVKANYSKYFILQAFDKSFLRKW